MPRLSTLGEADLNDEQRAVYDNIRSGPRGGSLGLQGPFGVYVRAPRVGDAAQNLGAAVRYNTTITQNVKEVAICTVGVFYQARFEFAAHAQLAAKAGVDETVIEAIRLGELPVFSDDRERIAHVIATKLLHEHALDDATYNTGKALLGEAGMVELVTTVGYYGLVSLTLNAFEIPLGEGMTDPFPKRAGGG